MVKRGIFTQGETALAVDGQGIYFYFDRKKKAPVLSDVNISVTQGAIYSLLGPSGCGKTTLLKCILGQHKLQQGSLKVFGRVPGSKGFFIPGRGVGYMPQDLALYSEMTTEETLKYFGSLYRMENKVINERISSLVKLLSLPDKKRQIKNLSGGQQRRVSFAAALVHKPPLLILDEPTVGVDPLLRQAIWDHLVSMAKNYRTTIIITTHYIEEARQAHIVSLMRNGQLLAERNPEDLTNQYGVVTLEDVFLRLCQNNCNLNDNVQRVPDDLTSIECPSPNDSAINGSECITKETNKVYTNAKKATYPSEFNGKKRNVIFDESQDDQDNKMALLSSSPYVKVVDYSSISSECCDSWMRLCCLTKKEFLRLRRNIFLIIYQMFMPSLQAIIFCLCIGGDPFDLPVAIVNMEEDPNGFSKTFLRSINNRTIHQTSFSNLTLAIESVKSGESWAAVHMGPQFTTCLVNRFLEGVDASNETIHCSNVKLYLDMSNQPIAMTIYFTLIASFQAFTNDMVKALGINPFLAELPLKIQDPIYGSSPSTFAEFITPGIILSMTYVLAACLTEISIILEKKQGLLDRTRVAGATVTEVFLSLSFPMLLMMVVQVILVLICTFSIFQIPCKGPIFWVVICVLLTGAQGMAFGFLVSSICSDENMAAMMAIGACFTNLILSGILWPLEAMPYYFRYLSYCLPLTQISYSMRCILSRGWTVTDNYIWDGYIISVGWIIILMVLSIILFKIKK